MSTALTQTTLSAALTAQASIMTVASATGITAPVSNFRQQLYVINPNTIQGELMEVTGVSGTQISVARLSTFRQPFVSGSLVMIGIAPITGANFGGAILQSFQETDPYGAVTAAQVAVTPWVNATNGNQWIRSVDGIWIPSWNNDSAPKGVSTAVASAAGVVVPTGPLFHITGALAITGFTNASMIGFTGGSFTVIPDGTFTWTTAVNIALAGTAVVDKTITFTWDSNAALWYPSVVA